MASIAETDEEIMKAIRLAEKHNVMSLANADTLFFVNLALRFEAIADEACLRAIFDRLEKLGLQTNVVVGFALDKKSYDESDEQSLNTTYVLFIRDEGQQAARKVHCKDIGELERIVRTHLRDLNIHYHGNRTGDRSSCIELKRSSPAVAYSGLPDSQPIESIMGDDGIKNIFAEGDTTIKIHFSAPLPEGTTYTDMHFYTIGKDGTVHSHGYGGDTVVGDNPGNVYHMGKQYSESCLPEKGDMVYLSPALTKNLGKGRLDARERVKVIDVNKHVVTIELFELGIECQPSDLFEALMTNQNYQCIEFNKDFGALDTAYVVLAPWQQGKKNDTVCDRLKRVPDPALRMGVVIEVKSNDTGKSKCYEISLNKICKSLENAHEKEGSYCVALQFQIMQCPHGIILMPSFPPGQIVHAGHQTGGINFSPSGASVNKEWAKELPRVFGNSEFIMTALQLLLDFADTLDSDVFDQCMRDCHSVIAKGDIQFPLGDIEKPPDAVIADGYLPVKLVGGRLLMQNQANKSAVLCPGLLNGNLCDIAMSLNDKSMRTTDEEKEKFLKSQQLILWMLPIDSLVNYAEAMLEGGLCNLKDSLLFLLKQLNLRRTKAVRGGDPNVARCFQGTNVFRTSIEAKLMGNTEEFEFDVICLKDAKGDMAEERVTTQKGFTFNTKDGEGTFKAMKPRQLNVLLELIGKEAAEDMLRKYVANILQLSIKAFTELMFDLYITHEDYAEFAVFATFAIMPSTSLNNVQKFVRSIIKYDDKETGEFVSDNMLQLWCLHHKHRNLDAAYTDLMEQSRSYIDETLEKELEDTIKQLKEKKLEHTKKHNALNAKQVNDEVSIWLCSTCAKGKHGTNLGSWACAGTPCNPSNAHPSYSQARLQKLLKQMKSQLKDAEEKNETEKKKALEKAVSNLESRLKEKVSECAHPNCKDVVCQSFQCNGGFCPKHAKCDKTYQECDWARTFLENGTNDTNTKHKICFSRFRPKDFEEYRSLLPVCCVLRILPDATIWLHQFIDQPHQTALLSMLLNAKGLAEDETVSLDKEELALILSDLGVITPTELASIVSVASESVKVKVSTKFEQGMKKKDCNKLQLLVNPDVQGKMLEVVIPEFKCHSNHHRVTPLFDVTNERVMAFIAQFEHSQKKNEKATNATKDETRDAMRRFVFNMPMDANDYDLLGREKPVEEPVGHVFPKFHVRQAIVMTQTQVERVKTGLGDNARANMAKLKEDIDKLQLRLQELSRDKDRFISQMIRFQEAAEKTLSEHIDKKVEPFRKYYSNNPVVAKSSCEDEGNYLLQICDPRPYTCIICLDDVKKGFRVCKNNHPRDHAICSECAPVIKENGTCPSCRVNIEGEIVERKDYVYLIHRDYEAPPMYAAMIMPLLKWRKNMRKA